MKRLIGLLALIPATAYASQSSMLCKTLDTNEYIDVVDKNSNSNEVLVQIGGGQFLDGVSSFDPPVLKVFIPLDTGSAILVYNAQTKAGGFGLYTSQAKQFHDIACRFRE